MSLVGNLYPNNVMYVYFTVSVSFGVIGQACNFQFFKGTTTFESHNIAEQAAPRLSWNQSNKWTETANINKLITAKTEL